MKERNLDKVIFPADGWTKRDLIQYYERIADVMLPHLQNRPLLLQRCTDGIDNECFYLKTIGGHFMVSMNNVNVNKADSYVTLAIVLDDQSLVYLAELACITPHMWLSRAPQVERPDLLVFDLDPTIDDFRDVREMAVALRDLLSALGLNSYPMTTGSRGLHVSVPLDRSADFNTVRNFARDVAHGLMDAYPEVVTMEQRKSSRK